jgi:hypothetical protein
LVDAASEIEDLLPVLLAMNQEVAPQLGHQSRNADASAISLRPEVEQAEACCFTTPLVQSLGRFLRVQTELTLPRGLFRIELESGP